jgi:flagellar motor protein MotB
VRRSKRFSDNEALCFARAVAVIERLRQSARLPVSMFAARAAENNRSPYPNDTPENRARNRTVVMRISALKK